MGRFSFSPPGRDVEKVVERSSWRECKNDDCSSASPDGSDESSTGSQTSGEEDEYPHPLGFPSYGRTRFFLDPPTESAQKVRRRLGFLKDAKDDFLVIKADDDMCMQSFPPLSCYTDPKTAPTSALLYYEYNDKGRPQQQHEDPLEGVTQLLQAGRIVQVDNIGPEYTRLLHETQQAGQQLLAMSKKAERELESTRQDVNMKQRQLEKEHQETRDAFRLILQRDQEAAEKVLKQQQAEQKAREEADQVKRDQEEKEQAERQRIADERQKKEEAKQQRVLEATEKRDEEQKAAAEEEAKKTEYVTKAKKKVAQLVELRASVAPFEKSKNVSKRRLRMKKTIKGKVNTLSQDANKIQTVANEVVQAINQAKQEDEELKQQIKAGNRNITEEMIRGKRYLVDLLASDTMVRAQAEGFNGTRGDGFPLANMLAMVSTQVKELLPILAAHMFTVCPTAIPMLPKVTKNESEKELMESLGMAKGKDGEYETFDRFLARTESLISLMAEIMASNPPDHVLMGGHKGALEWLERFLGLLPPPPETMPLLTAPVLDAFLTGAGHMLANTYPEEFRKDLDVVMKDIAMRLDEGPVGAPSALRLRKLVENGFDSFKFELPSKAIPSLYNAGSLDGLPTSSSFGQSQSANTQASLSIPMPASNPFGGTSTSNPFGGTLSSSGVGAPPFGQQTSSTGPQSSSGGFGSQNQSTMQAGFGGGGTASSNAQPFGRQSSGAASPFPNHNQSIASSLQQPTSSFGQPAQSPAHPTTSFGGGFAQQQQSGLGAPAPASSSASSFGQQSTTTGVFGSQSQWTMQANSSFGQQSTNAGFGSQIQSSSTNSPFGQPAAGSAFGGQNQPTMQQASPFGAQPTKSPFGTVSNPFGAPAGQNNATFVASSTATSFGASSASTQVGAYSTATSFGASSTAAPFGVSSAATPFGASSTTTPFGASSTTTLFGAPSSQPSPFGSGGGTPFSGNQNAAFGGNQSNSFGGGQQSGGGFGNQGGGSGQPPCKFFAQGNCRFGANCRFSHELPGGGGGFGGGFSSGNNGNNPFSGDRSNNPFGGPRR